MSLSVMIYMISSAIVFCISLYGLIMSRHWVRKILALNVMGSGVFLFFGALSRQFGDGESDPVPQAMVITGIVVAISVTAFALSLAQRIYSATQITDFPEEEEK
jgi:multicomponent Na+:H+ antiporter subunit C